MTSFIDFYGIAVGAIANGKQDLVEVEENEQISVVLDKLKQSKITTVPVYKQKGPGSKEDFCRHGKEYIGMVSTCDIVSFILHNAKLSSTSEINADMITRSLDMPIAKALGETFESSLNMAFTVVTPATPLSQVVDEMFQGLQTLRDLPIANFHIRCPPLPCD
jgi:CBS domain-containing protein